MRGNRAYSKETEELVIQNIFLNGKNGISNKKLSELTGIERQIISELCKDNKDSRIRIVEKGRWRTYYPIFDAIDSLVFDRSSFFGRQLRYYFLQSKNSGFKIGDDELIQLYQNQIEYLKDLKKLENTEFKFEQVILSIQLQNFILKIGAMFTFILLQAMSPKLSKQLINNKNINIEKKYINKFLNDWIKEIFSNTNLLYEFTNTIISSYFGARKCNSNNDYSINELIDNSMQILKKLYPDLIKPITHYDYNESNTDIIIPGIITRLQNIYNNLDKKIIEEKKRLKRDICEHEFKRITKIDPSHNITEFYCERCKTSRQIQKNKEITDETMIQKINSSYLAVIKNENKYRKSTTTSADIYRCKINKHIWTRIKIIGQPRIFELNKNLIEKYRCILCGRFAELELINSEKSKKIREKIIDEIGSDIFTFRIAGNILSKFYWNQNNKYTAMCTHEFYYPESRWFRKENYPKSEFKKDKDKILDILLKLQIIEKKSYQGLDVFNWNRKRMIS